MISLKEWASIVKALERGDQCIILRKGGIMDTASGFSVESKKFLLFPTWEHQKEDHIKAEFQHYLKEAKEDQPEQGFNKITSYASVVAEFDMPENASSDTLSDMHIWSRSYVQERMNWRPEKRIKAVLLRVFNIPPVLIPIEQEHKGCRSWIEINAKINGGRPVLTESDMSSKMARFNEIAA